VVSGRITTYLDPGLGWTKPMVVACCRTCGTELARHPNQAKAERAARRTRCPSCGTRAAGRLPGTTSPAIDLALARGRRSRPTTGAAPQPTNPLPASDWPEGGEPDAWYLAARC
jgi:DNA-directed RNA polymerase subunit RPC12/RpoP